MAGNGSRRKRETAEGTLRVKVPGTKGKRKWVAKTVHGGPPWVKKELHKLVGEANSKYVNLRPSTKLSFAQVFDPWVVGLSLTTDD
jgi:hypothetical protein